MRKWESTIAILIYVRWNRKRKNISLIMEEREKNGYESYVEYAYAA